MGEPMPAFSIFQPRPPESRCSPFLSLSLALRERWQAEPDGEGNSRPLSPAPWELSQALSVTCGDSSLTCGFGHARGKTIINRFLRPSRRFATRRESLWESLCLPFLSLSLAPRRAYACLFYLQASPPRERWQAKPDGEGNSRSLAPHRYRFLYKTAPCTKAGRRFLFCVRIALGSIILLANLEEALRM